jgi:hypothetical protein
MLWPEPVSATAIATPRNSRRDMRRRFPAFSVLMLSKIRNPWRQPAMPTNRSSKTARKTASKSGRSNSAPDAIALLKADHRKVEGLFAKFEKARAENVKQDLVEQICTELIVHTMLEEEIFYPACRSEDVEEDMMDEAQVEHDGAKVLIRDLMKEEPDSEMYDAKVKVLSEYIKHHVKEEEKPGSGVFAEAKKQDVDMQALGEQMAARKKELMADSEAGKLPDPEPKSFSLSGGKSSSKSSSPRKNAGAEDERNTGGVGGALRNITHAARRATFGE